MIALEQARQHLESLGLKQVVEVLDNTLDVTASKQLTYPEMLEQLLGPLFSSATRISSVLAISAGVAVASSSPSSAWLTVLSCLTDAQELASSMNT